MHSLAVTVQVSLRPSSSCRSSDEKGGAGGGGGRKPLGTRAPAGGAVARGVENSNLAAGMDGRGKGGVEAEERRKKRVREVQRCKQELAVLDQEVFVCVCVCVCVCLSKRVCVCQYIVFVLFCFVRVYAHGVDRFVCVCVRARAHVRVLCACVRDVYDGIGQERLKCHDGAPIPKP